ncbi:hypothetical protein BDY17DRAFT_336570 [Neohortaea acidophila]|uniref:non-specific serine/threonine protein kinase n=1 Tax=Neohortaea acidophila TaxID=245834 RepID=A0A6A6PKC9_9PEZI|nr:uncharacterized protein BDY17DRAFT_336570 [Neohortaea acidophila]KAF2480462.1 hypothetical protein BDY17DRAFT_336570 [Neohortaea acidophila]
MEIGEATQCTQNTQGAVDPRRMGRNNSGLSESDISDVVCILHPCSPAAFKIVASTAERTPFNVLQNDGFQNYEDPLSPQALEEQETFILDKNAPYQAMDLALRFSTPLKNAKLGFVFGRNDNVCDIVLAADTFKRVSNMHFSIFINNSGVLMLQDMSTNGTIVDDVLLKGKISWQTRMLNPGSMIQILSPKSDEIVKFIVRIPFRDGHFEAYERKFQLHMHTVATAEAKARQDNIQYQRPVGANGKTQNGGSVKAPLVQNQFGMHWSGGDKYNVVGSIGKGAFATVYQLATKNEGQLYAAKELEKRKFMKNGILDRKLDNEMQIMKAVSHPNIVQYIDYHDHINHMYIIMEFVPCGDLQKYLGHRGKLSEGLGMTMAQQVLDALAYLHKNKITHRDLKPDNILIANMDEAFFSIKLSDFGLSKVVKDNETFLKTFCGTLLYCAPEVFPHFDSHVTGKGTKRTRRGLGQASTKFHGYSQSVDIWSFGAVLWFSLCLKPPFEGVADNTGRGMFDKIMMTPLDLEDLRSQGVSETAMGLLIAMLNTDPAARPSAVQCLQHEWFDSITQGQSQLHASQLGGLGPIQEEDVTAAAETPDVARLSLGELINAQARHLNHASSGSQDFLDPRESKRFKTSDAPYREHDEMEDSSPDIFRFSGSIPIMHQSAGGQRLPGVQTQPAPQKLFGEISQAALRSSGLLGKDGYESPDVAGHEDSDGALASPSLLGAESLVRELNMDSPRSVDSQDADAEAVEPVTPQTPGAFKLSRSHGNGSHAISGAEEVTPKQPQKSTFNRQIQIPIPASFYYDPLDPATHNPEYASKVSGRDYVGDVSRGEEDISLPATSNGSITQNDDDAPTQNPAVVAAFEAEPPAPQQSSQFVKPPPRLGRLISTPDSYAPINLTLSTRVSTWGRAPSNTHPHPDKADTRIPKRGVIIWHHAKDIDAATTATLPEEGGEDAQAWLKLPDLHCVISTESSLGIHVNGVLLKKGDAGHMCFGRVYSGDRITVFHDTRDGKPGLTFVCEFYHGEAKAVRPVGSAPFLVETAKVTAPVRQSMEKKQGEEKENSEEALVTTKV